ncbi:MAG: GyrI-like domain-containing protein [Sphaerochaeta sp.]
MRTAGLYKAKETPSLLTIPSVAYLSIDGWGDANDASYEVAIDLLFSLHTLLCEQIESSEKPILECLWTKREIENREPWSWSMMIGEPTGTTDAIFQEARDELAFKEGFPTQDLYRCDVEDGLCVTLLHTGPFSFEGKSFYLMDAFCKERNLVRRGRSHREIYLDRPTSKKEDDLKTILRLPVRVL